MTRLNTLQMASGWDQSLSDSDNIEGFTPTGGSPTRIHVSIAGDVYIFVNGDPEDYSRGQEVFDAAGGFGHRGKKRVDFKLPRIQVDSLAWLYDNYVGQVTARLRTDRTTYATYNCRMVIPQSTIRIVGRNHRDAVMQFFIIEAL